MARPETAQQIAAFKQWCLHDRKVNDTVKATGIPKRTLINWMNAYEWHARADGVLDSVVANVNHGIVEQKTEEANHRLDCAQEILKWAMDYIRAHEPDDTAVAVNAAKSAILLERKELGLDKEQAQATLPQVNVNVDVRTLVALEIKRLREAR